MLTRYWPDGPAYLHMKPREPQREQSGSSWEDLGRDQDAVSRGRGKTGLSLILLKIYIHT